MAETALMAVNRYRLRHQARMKKRYAILILQLLKRPDRLLGMILIGNTCANILSSALATLIAVYFFGNTGVVLATILLTFLVLIFAEVAPKTVAACYPEKVARWICWPVYILLKFFYPFVWLINTISNGVLRILRIKMTGLGSETLSREELRSIVYETSGRVPSYYQNMLLGILDLNKVTVNDVMVPHHEIIGLNLDTDWKSTCDLILKTKHDWLPVFHGSVNQIVGMLHLRDLLPNACDHHVIEKETLVKLLKEPYFVPEKTPLNVQLLNFQQKHVQIALVVDEYGEVQGLITLTDILEEIVGDFVNTVTSGSKIIQAQSDGSYLVDGAITIRELNRVTSWNLPSKGPRTLNGLITEHLESIPRAGIGLRINQYPIEIIQVQKNRVKVARIFPVK